MDKLLYKGERLMLDVFSRGNVYYYDLGDIQPNRIEGKKRPVVIISNDIGNKKGDVVTIAPITTRPKSSVGPYQVYYEFEGRPQVILLEQCRCINKHDLGEYIGRLSELVMKKIDIALAVEFDLNISERELSSLDFLNKLESTLNLIIKQKTAKFDKYIEDKFTKYEEHVNNVNSRDTVNYINSFTDIQNKFITTNDNITNLKSMIDETNKSTVSFHEDLKIVKDLYVANSKKLDDILNSLIYLYKSIGNTLTPAKNIFEQSIKSSNEAIKEEDIEKKDNRKANTVRYTIEFSTQFIKDYYSMSKASCMKKYNLENIQKLYDKKSAIQSFLKRKGINYKDLIDNEKNKPEVDTKNEMNNDKLLVSDKNKKKGKRPKNWQPTIKYDDIEGLKQFLNDCNTYDVDTICGTLNITPKQLSNRKYLIKKSLKDRNIDF